MSVLCKTGQAQPKLLTSVSLLHLRIRSGMVKTKMNMKNNRNYSMDLWKCDDCRSMDSQSHIVWCPAYAGLREGKDLNCDQDLVTYYQEVMKLREDL